MTVAALERAMTALDRLIPAPRLIEIDHVDVAGPPERVWPEIRHGDLARGRIARALFAIRELPSRLAGKASGDAGVRVDELVSTVERPGFQILVDDPPHEVAVGAVGKVWEGQIPFVHVDGAELFAGFAAEGFVKVAWAVRVLPRGEHDARVEVELRVDATDEESWTRFKRYFQLIGPGSRFIRHAALAELSRTLGTPEPHQNERPRAGAALLPAAGAQVTHYVDIAAPPIVIWPWLVQMGCRRAGFYSVDALDNGGRRSAREIYPDLQHVAVGDVLPATSEGDDGFEVLRVEAPQVLLLGGLYDSDEKRQLAFAAERPERFWQVTWAFVLEPLDAKTTRLHVRARAAFPSAGLHLAWMRFVHHFMEKAQLRHLAARVEGRLPRDDWRDVIEGIGGAAVIAAALVTPFMRGRRNHWGLSEAEAARDYPGDGLVPEPRWSWTHGVEIDAPAERVWPWLAQIGATRGGFYSYQWLENVAGCRVANAEALHPDWEIQKGDALVLHPKIPPPTIVEVERGHHFIAGVPVDERAVLEGRGWSTMSWLFMVEPLGETRCRVVSRHRVASSDDLATELSFGPAFLEPIGFAMDRRMLLGLKERAEGRA